MFTIRTHISSASETAICHSAAFANHRKRNAIINLCRMEEIQKWRKSRVNNIISLNVAINNVYWYYYIYLIYYELVYGHNKQENNNKSLQYNSAPAVTRCRRRRRPLTPAFYSLEHDHGSYSAENFSTEQIANKNVVLTLEIIVILFFGCHTCS